MDSAGGFVVPTVDLRPGHVFAVYLPKTAICFCGEKGVKAVKTEEK